MNSVIEKIFRNKKGILAADESVNTMNKRLRENGIEENEENRRLFRHTLFSVKGIEKYISGVILFDESFWQSGEDEILFTDKLKSKNISVGIKVDMGLEDFGEGEKVSKGLDNLEERIQRYKGVAEFAKWRVVYNVEPSSSLIKRNNDTLAEYARIVVKNGIVPILEPEILMDGSHTISEMKSVANNILLDLFKRVEAKKVPFSSIILKTGFILPGNESTQHIEKEIIAKETIELFNEVIPEDIGGIVFLSGGLSPTSASDYLKEISQRNNFKYPLTFSFGRALQGEGLSVWKKDRELSSDKLLEAYKRNSESVN